MRITNTTKWLAATAVAVAAIGAAATAPPVAAEPAPIAQDFYLPPDPLPDGEPGDIIRSEPFQLALSLPTGGPRIPAEATRIMYRSNDTHDLPTADTGTFLRPALPSTGPGERPVVAFTVGTHGQGDQCAPSKLFSQLLHYTPPLDAIYEFEVNTVYLLLAQGMAVVITDYHGLGTPQMHDFMNRKATAYANLDAVRAAQRLPGSGVGPASPVAFFGYSQGGQAAAAAAEAQDGYAPELNVRGTYAGLPVADFPAMYNNSGFDGPDSRTPGLGGALFGYVFNGMYADYPEVRPEIDAALSAEGRDALARAATTCIAEAALRFGFRSSRSFFATGESFPEAVQRLPELNRIMGEQRIGTLRPAAPVLIVAGTNDDIVAYPQARQLAVDWCGLGATVQLSTITWIPPVLPGLVVGHILAALPGLLEAIGWISARFAGVPAPSNCTTQGN